MRGHWNQVWENNVEQRLLGIQALTRSRKPFLLKRCHTSNINIKSETNFFWLKQSQESKMPNHHFNKWQVLVFLCWTETPRETMKLYRIPRFQYAGSQTQQMYHQQRQTKTCLAGAPLGKWAACHRTGFYFRQQNCPTLSNRANATSCMADKAAPAYSIISGSKQRSLSMWVPLTTLKRRRKCPDTQCLEPVSSA